MKILDTLPSWIDKEKWLIEQRRELGDLLNKHGYRPEGAEALLKKNVGVHELQPMLSRHDLEGLKKLGLRRKEAK